jgi:peptidoglycan hydrolase CwlO-like protein
MTTFSDIRQTLQQKLENLPDAQLQEILQFVNDLPSQMSEFQNSNINQLDSDIDPLSEFIGAVSHGSLAQNIDRELYE